MKAQTIAAAPSWLAVPSPTTHLQPSTSLPGCSVQLWFRLCLCGYIFVLAAKMVPPLRGAEQGVKEVGLTYFLVVKGGPKGGCLEGAPTPSSSSPLTKPARTPLFFPIL